MDSLASAVHEPLDPSEWHARRARHEERVDAWTAPHLARRRAGETHPVEDFLFTYYSQRPAALRRWHPGFARVLTGPGAEAYRERSGYADLDGGVGVALGHVLARRRLVAGLRHLLVAIDRRPPRLDCFGMHEWAMVYRLSPGQVRHASWPLRLGSAGTDAVVESQRVSCSHFDAVRFFSEPAGPRNTLRPGRDDRAAYEQPGCLHAGMDLYKHAYRLSPMVCSDLVADCFELARDIRALDMRASPYDLTALGYSPVRVETVAGRREYVAAQRAFADRAAPLRRALIDECDRLLAAVRTSGQASTK